MVGVPLLCLIAKGYPRVTHNIPRQPMWIPHSMIFMRTAVIAELAGWTRDSRRQFDEFKRTGCKKSVAKTLKNITIGVLFVKLRTRDKPGWWMGWQHLSVNPISWHFCWHMLALHSHLLSLAFVRSKWWSLKLSHGHLPWWMSARLWLRSSNALGHWFCSLWATLLWPHPQWQCLVFNNWSNRVMDNNPPLIQWFSNAKEQVSSLQFRWLVTGWLGWTPWEGDGESSTMLNSTRELWSLVVPIGISIGEATIEECGSHWTAHRSTA